MRQNEMGDQPAHVGVVVDDHVAADSVLREPGGDFVRPATASHAGRSRVQHAASESLRLQHVLQLDDRLAVPPGGRDHDIGVAARQDLVQHLDARGVQIPVPIPPADRRQHPVDVEKDHPSRHVRGIRPAIANVSSALP